MSDLVQIYRQYRRSLVGNWIGDEKNHYQKTQITWKYNWNQLYFQVVCIFYSGFFITNSVAEQTATILAINFEKNTIEKKHLEIQLEIELYFQVVLIFR